MLKSHVVVAVVTFAVVVVVVVAAVIVLRVWSASGFKSEGGEAGEVGEDGAGECEGVGRDPMVEGGSVSVV